MAPNTLEIDEMLERYYLCTNVAPHQQDPVITLRELRGVATEARRVFLAQPLCLELETPLQICGDIHGQFHDLLRIFAARGHPPKTNYLFLGDYVDRGKRGLPVLMTLLCNKLKFPENFFMLRGNHECEKISRVYGFYDECIRKLKSPGAWYQMCKTFQSLPVCAIVSEKILCMHGGLSSVNDARSLVSMTPGGIICVHVTVSTSTNRFALETRASFTVRTCSRTPMLPLA